jgi:hypothetical protein
MLSSSQQWAPGNQAKIFAGDPYLETNQDHKKNFSQI